jgi:hypothetical protein
MRDSIVAAAAKAGLNVKVMPIRLRHDSARIARVLGVRFRSDCEPKGTPSCKDSLRSAKLRHDQALKEGVYEVAKAGFRAGM